MNNESNIKYQKSKPINIPYTKDKYKSSLQVDASFNFVVGTYKKSNSISPL